MKRLPRPAGPSLAFVFLLLLTQLAGPLRAQDPRPIAQVWFSSFDFDDNFMITDGKIHLRNTVTHQEVAVSTADWALVKDQVGKEGRWKNFVVPPDGLREFEGDLFSQQIARALKKDPESVRGPRFRALYEALRNEKTRKTVSFISARGTTRDQFLAGLKLMVDAKVLPALPDRENIYCVTGPDLPKSFLGENPADSKAKVMRKQLDDVDKTPMPENATLVDDREGRGKKAKLHVWDFSDDDYDNFSKAVEVLSAEVARGRWKNVKIVLHFTGLNNPDQQARAVVIRSDGHLRPAIQPDETPYMSYPLRKRGTTHSTSPARVNAEP